MESISERLERILAALEPFEIPGKPAGKPAKPAHLAKILNVAPSSLSRWMKNEVEPRGKQKERIDILYRAVCEVEAGNPQAHGIVQNLISPVYGMTVGAAVGFTPLSLGLVGVVAAAGLGWLLSDKNDEEEEE